MADFRKLFSVLAVVALMMGFALSANAQSALLCSGNAGVPPTLRAEGMTELVGDVVLNCTGGNPAQPFLANFQIYLNTNITSRLLSSGGGASEALILIDEPTTPTLTGTAPNAFRGVKASGENSIVWLGVPFTPPGTATRIVRITNVRANASQLLPPGSASQLIPPQVIMYISISGSTAIPVNNPQQVVGYVQTGLTFDLRNCANTGGGANIAFNQCTSTNSDIFNGNIGGTFAVPSTPTTLRFQENFATAFKPRIVAGQDPSVPGTVYSSESGYVNTSALGAETGVATNGTKLVARFTNIPDTVKIYAAINNSVSGTALGSASLVATLQAGSDPNGVGGLAATSLGNWAACGGATPAMAQIPVVNGAATAVWEVTASNANASEVAIFPISVAYIARTASNQPGIGTATVLGSFGPFYASPTGTTQSATLPIARFVDTGISASAFTVRICVTNLLFPFVSNQAGFDTGIAISNTSVDIFGTAAQAGTCDINYFGTGPSGSATAKTKETSQVVTQGSQLIFGLATGGNLGVTGNPGFQGYIIARCSFQFAHGFAFISDFGNNKTAHGYLALVMDGGAFFRSNTASAAEQLNN